MTLNDLIEALAAEVELAQPRLAQQLEQLQALQPDDEQFMECLADYSTQAQRMGEAADMAGFPGLQAVCNHVLENSLALSMVEGAQREALLGFLRAWPPLIVNYLRNMADPSAAAGLMDHLVRAPFPMEEEHALKVTHMLGSMPAQLKLPGGDAAAGRMVLARPEDVALQMPEGQDPHLAAGFFQEAPEQARYLVTLALNLASGQGDSSDLGAAKRVVHTLKGTGSIIGLRGLATMGHHLEDVLEHLERGGPAAVAAVAEILLDAAYCIEQMVGHVCGTETFPEQAQRVLQAVLDLANRIDRGESIEEHIAREDPVARPSALSPPTSTAAVTAAARGTAQAPALPAAVLRVSVQRVDELFRLSGEISVHGSAMEVRLKAVADRARELLEQNLRVQKRLFELETLIDVRGLALMRSGGAHGADAGFDPLEMDQYSELHGTSRALVEEAADSRALSQRLHEELSGLGGVHARQQRLAKDLQHLVAGTRMAEVGTLESRLQRTVRSTCQATGKQAVLELRGGDTLIDTDVLNQLAEPLLHILRNSVDHGIEPPAQRREAGKNPAGRIELTFSRSGQQVVLGCRDDGAGLDLAAIRRKAIERGLLDATRQLDDEQTARLILLPGFSTRDAVSEISGRGVGLDVAAQWAATMQGAVAVRGAWGQGCTIELRFAASLTTQHSLVVDVGGQRLALASVQVEQAVARGLGDFAEENGQLVYRQGKRTLRADRLQELTSLPAVAQPKTLADCDAVIVRHDNALRALAVDRLVDSRELLVKSPGPYARHLRGVAGLSILGDGSVAVSLDLSELFSGRRAGVSAPRETATAAPLAATARRQALIVDDALTVRNSLLELMRDAGFDAQAARDGMDAVDALRSMRPDIVLTDLEMPNMNGIELTAHIRSRQELRDLPVIMITSRSQEKHRRLAQQAGVSAYMTKPYNDGELLAAIQQALPA